MLRVPLITLLALLAGCYSPSISSKQYKCGSGGCPAETPICAPDGYCYRVGDDTDMPVVTPGDMAQPGDLSVPMDMVEPTSWAPVPGPVRGCVNMGWQLSVNPELYACTGGFSNSEFFTVCAATHVIARSAARFDLARIGKFTKGFFIGYAAGSEENGCSWDAGTLKTAKRQIFGIGSGFGGSYFDSQSKPCGWPRGTRCDYSENSTDSPFKCPRTVFQNGDADFANQLYLGQPNNGVLCTTP